jgi:NitT/TauT family transport system substrate-binding protein
MHANGDTQMTDTTGPRAGLRAALLATAVLALPAAAAAQELTEVSFGTNWLAQAEHGGFYQSVADGTYAECGLDVTIVPGGPQVNNRALMLAGRLDFHMGGDLLQAFNAAKEDIPVVAVAATFQKHPQVILAHPGEAESWEDLKDLTLLIGDNGFASYYQWMIAAHGFTAEQREPYTFNPAPFIADPRKGMQGYLSSEPYAVETETGWKPNVFLIADAGYSTYATTIETMQATIDERPEVVECFVEGSIKGWYNYLLGDSSAADALIKADNPDMTQDKIDFAKASMMENGIVISGDALELGIGAMTDEKISGFYDAMVEAGVIEAGLDYSSAYTLDFVNKGVGMDLYN